MDDAVIKVKVQEHDELLREHGRRLDKIEQDSAAFRAVDTKCAITPEGGVFFVPFSGSRVPAMLEKRNVRH